jgi:eukaryotic-like serine/threonine-protein kinase
LTQAVPPRDPDWTPPPSFDGFTLLKPIGSGGMGAVYLAREVALDRLVAIKVIAAASPDATARERFLREGRSLARLSHPNVVSIFRIGEIARRPYLAYEYIEGRRLDHLARPIDWKLALGLGLGLARGLAAAHQAGVLHRDIKPSNAILSPTGDAKLIDFGLARRVEPSALTTTLPLFPIPREDGSEIEGDTAVLAADPLGDGGERLTAHSGLIGTPLYLAPELWLGAPATERADVFGLGVLLYELVAGELPESGMRGVERVDALRRRVMPPLAGRAAAVGHPLADLVDRMVQRDPERRPSAAEVRDRLEEMAALFRPFAAASSGDFERAAAAVRGSFERVVTRHEDFAARFYRHMFAEAPDLRRLFGHDLAPQQRMITATLRLAVDNLHAPERLVPILAELGRRHASYGVRRSHLEVMGRAILAALAELDPGWNAETARAWTEAYDHIAGLLERGLHGDRDRAVTPPPRAPRRPPPPVRWLERPGGDLAYRVVGDGDGAPLVVAGEWVTHLGGFLRGRAAELVVRLGALGRVVLFDARGTGLSSRALPPADAAGGDLAALLERLGEPAAVVAIGSALASAARAAVARPALVRHLVGLGAGARGPGLGPGGAAALAAEVRSRWGEPLRLETLAPTMAADRAERAAFADQLTLGASPGEAIALLDRLVADDATPALRAVRCPITLVARRGDRARPAAESTALAAAVPGVRAVLVDGADHLPWAGDQAALVAALGAVLAAG